MTLRELQYEQEKASIVLAINMLWGKDTPRSPFQARRLLWITRDSSYPIISKISVQLLREAVDEGWFDEDGPKPDECAYRRYMKELNKAEKRSLQVAIYVFLVLMMIFLGPIIFIAIKAFLGHD